MRGAPYPPEYDHEDPCAICGHFADSCTCPECVVCGTQGDPGCINYHMPWQRWFEHAIYPEAKDDTIALEICTVEEPWFICGVYGRITLESLKDIAGDLGEGDWAKKVPDNAAVLFTVWHWIEGETQYGSGYGDVAYIHGWWDVLHFSVTETVPDEPDTLPEEGNDG